MKTLNSKWHRAAAYLTRDCQAHIKAHGMWACDAGKLQTALESNGIDVPALAQLLERAVDHVEEFYGGKESEMTREERKTIKESRALIARTGA